MFGAVKQSPTLQTQFRRLISVKQLSGVRGNNQDSQKAKTNQTRVLSNRRETGFRLPAFDVSKREMASGGSEERGRNKLGLERSPYLLQHANNPVDWYPWGEEAFQRSKKENKPIFLSVGYSTCHWCHVMERESFESEEIAQVLNEHYISIKVDREERPDVDRIYMSFVQRTTGSGGWPMSVFLTPELEPLFGGTYFPPKDMYGRIGFKTLLETIAKQWKEQHRVLKEEAKSSTSQLKKMVSMKLVRNAGVPSEAGWSKCYQQLSSSYDSDHGGFSDAPKFPQPIMFNFLFHFYSKNQRSLDGTKALEMCLHSLKKMAYGGIHDHVNTGFARYSVDELWHLPHFEKMLYDQGQLAVAYTDAFVISRDDFFAETAEDILNYVGRDLGHPMGGFYGAEDADSYPKADSASKKEGAFCVWEFDEIKSLLTGTTHGVPDFEVYAYHFNVKPRGNVPGRYDHNNELTNKNVLGCTGSYEDTAAHFSLSEEQIKEILSKSHRVLYAERQKRPRPHVDTKIVTAWNGLMISGFAKAGFALKKSKYTKRAADAAGFIKGNLYKDKRLLRCCYGETNGDVRFTEQLIYGFLDDYAFLIRGLIDLYESTLDGDWLEFAEVLQDKQDAEFWDSQGSGYFTSYSDANVIIRDKEDHDGAEPCGNSVSVHNLLRLGAYLNRKDYKEKAAKILSAYSERLLKIPVALPEMTSALMSYHTEPTQIFIVGNSDDGHTQLLLDEVRAAFIPGRQIALLDGPDGRSKVLYKRHEILSKLKPVQGKSAVYVCRNLACGLPITDPEVLRKSLKSGGVLLTSDSSSSD